MSVLIRSLRCFSATLWETWPVLALMVTPLAARCEVFFGRNCWGMFCAATPVAPVTALSDLALVLDLPAAAVDEPNFPDFPVEPRHRDLLPILALRHGGLPGGTRRRTLHVISWVNDQLHTPPR